VTLKTGLALGFGQGHWKWYHLIDRIRVPFHSNHGAILYRLRDIVTHWSKKCEIIIPRAPVFSAAAGGDPVGISRCLIHPKTRMTGLQSGEEIMTIHQAVLIKYWNVTETDRRRDGRTDRIAISISREENDKKVIIVNFCNKQTLRFY